MSVLSADLRIRDGFSGTFSKALKDTGQIQSKLKIVGAMSVRPVVRIKDEVTGQISKIKSGLFSLQGAATMAMGAFGIGKLGEATIGAAMDFETQMVSMEHWLNGNKELAKEYTGWLDQLAQKTPFEMADLFPAGSRAIGISGGDISQAKELVKLATDMAGLTPGKTVQDAAEALADAQMGEFERMKEFNMKFSKEQMDAVGGFAGFMTQAEAKFAGGAEVLSQTARGRVSTITDFMKTSFRSVGDGILTSMNPRLQKITGWFDQNQDKVTHWKSKLVSLGNEAFEGILSRGETFLGQLMAKFDDPGFQRLDWGGKLGVIMGEVEAIVVPKAGEVAGKIGAAFGSTFARGVISAIESDRRVALLTGAWAGLSVPGPPWAKLLTFGAIAAAPDLKNAGADFTNPITESQDRWQTRKEAGVFGGAPDKNDARWGSLDTLNADETSIFGGIKNKGWQGLFGHGHASGLPYVPYDNYPALLHRGERVVTASDNRQYNNKRLTLPNVTININGSDKSPREIAKEAVEELERVLLETSRNMPQVSMVY